MRSSFIKYRIQIIKDPHLFSNRSSVNPNSFRWLSLI